MKTDFKTWGFRELIVGVVVLAAIIYFFWVSIPVPKGYFASPHVESLKQIFALWGGTGIAVYCGTTKGSKDKDDTISSLTKKDNNSAAPADQPSN